jgi:amino acid transporter
MEESTISLVSMILLSLTVCYAAIATVGLIALRYEPERNIGRAAFNAFVAVGYSAVVFAVTYSISMPPLLLPMMVAFCLAVGTISGGNYLAKRNRGLLFSTMGLVMLVLSLLQ